jgi:hypothetical protein
MVDLRGMAGDEMSERKRNEGERGREGEWAKETMSVWSMARSAG